MQDEKIKNQQIARLIAASNTAGAAFINLPANANRRALMFVANASVAYPGGVLNNWFSAFVYVGNQLVLRNQYAVINPYSSLILRIEDYGAVIAQAGMVQWNVDIADYDYAVWELVMNDPTGEMLQPLTQL